MARFAAAAGELLPVVFERLARGERGEPQEGGDYQSMFEDAYRQIDPTQPAAEIHRQVRAWSFMPPINVFVPRPRRATREGAADEPHRSRRCGSARVRRRPLWIVESVSL